MPDFAPNYTYRFRVRYRGNNQTHHFVWRFAPATLPASNPTIAALVEDFLTNLGDGNFYSDFAILGADYALADSDVFLPSAVVPAFLGTVSTAGRPESAEATALSFVGRSDIGHRAVFFIYGTIFQPVSAAGALDFRIHGAENANVANAVVTLNGSVPNLVANDGVHVNWYPYANLKYNDYWVRQVRQ